MKKYDNYKDSGLEWLGMVPEHWKIVPLKYLLSEPLQYGANESADNCNPLEPRYIRITDITEGGKLRKSTYRTLPYQKAEGYMLKKGDILFARSGATVGKTFLFEEDYDACFAGYLIKASCNERLLPMFLYYFTSSNSYENWKNSIFNQATIQNIGADKYCALPIPTPSCEEQKRIISFLSPKVGQIDVLISEKEKMVEDLKAYRSSLITETVTKGLDKGVEMKDSGDIIFKSIPQHWNLIPIKYLTSKVGSGVTPTGGANVYLQEGIIFLRSQNIYPTGLQLDDVVYISEAIDNNMAATRVNKGDVLLNITGASIGRCFTYNRDERANVNQHVCIVRPKQTLLNGKYLQYLFNSNAGQNFINSVQNGTNREGLNFEQIKNFSVPVPSLDEQQTIIKFLEEKLSKIDALQIELEHQLSDLKSYKSSLITEAVTGKIDLRDWQTKKS